MQLARHKLEIAPAQCGTRRRAAAEVILLGDPSSIISETGHSETEVVVAVASNNRHAMQVQVSPIEKHHTGRFGSRHPVAFDDIRKRLTLSARIVQHPKVMIAQTNGDRALREAVTQIFQGLSGLLRT